MSATTKAGPWLSGHCGIGNPPALHERCRGVSPSGKPCSCPHHAKVAEERPDPAQAVVPESFPSTAPVEVTEPGLYPDMDEEVYHADPVPERLGRSLSHSGAKTLIQKSPAHFQHARLHRRPDKRCFDVGHAVHAKVLGVGMDVLVVEADNWRTKAAQEADKEARAAGKVPLLRKDYDATVTTAEAVLAHPLARLLFASGQPEQSMFWQDVPTGVFLRGRLDWMPEARNGRMIVPDLKTAVSADPKVFGKKAADFCYQVQAAWYLDGIDSLGLAEEAAFVFVLVEPSPPHVVQVVELDDEALRIGRQQARRAIDTYAECMGTGTWPGYSDEIEVASLPGYYVHIHDQESYA